jgi:ADP-ribose pyrophosphatase
MKDIKRPTGYILHNRRLVCENSQFDVFFDHVEDSDGSKVTDYLVLVPRRKAANLITGVAILPIVDGRYALLRIYRHAIDDYSWEIPRGFVEPGEENIESVIRELGEETGLKCEKNHIRSLGYLTPDAGILAARIHLFVATQCQWRAPFIVNEMGHRELKLFNASEMVQMAKESVVQDPYTLITYYRYILGDF